MLIRKTLIFLCAILCANVLLAQIGTTFTIDGINYKVTGGSEVEVSGHESNAPTSVTIPATVTNNNTTYTVTSIGSKAFYYYGGLYNLESITLPNTIVSIGNSAFFKCALTSIVIPNSVTTIGHSAFSDCTSLREVVIGSGVTSIGNYAFKNCTSLIKITSLAVTSPTLEGDAFEAQNVFYGVNKSLVTLVVPTGSDNDYITSWGWEDNNVQEGAQGGDTGEGGDEGDDNNNYIGQRFQIGNLTYEITGQNTVMVYDCETSATSETIPVTVSHNNITYTVTAVGSQAFNGCNNLTSITCLSENAPTLANNAFGNRPRSKTLTIPFGSDYSSWESTTSWSKINHKIYDGDEKTLSTRFVITNARAIINEGVLVIEQGGEIVNKTNTNVGGTIEIVSQSANQGNWNFFGAPFANYKLEVIKERASQNEDVAVCKYDYNTGGWSSNWATTDTSMSTGEGAFAYHFYTGTMTFTSQGASTTYTLNNGDVSVTHSLVNSEGGHWMALANPYPAKLSVSTFVNAHRNSINNNQGRGVYVWNGTSFALKTSGEINVAQGFFVNFRNSGSRTATFKKNQIYNYNSASKSEVAPREFIELALVNGEESVKVYFAQNEEAEQEYDIFDANKMFATMGAAEPYFLTEGIALVKEEVKTLPYYAIMNVRSEDDAEMNFVMKNIPEGYAVSIIDGEEVIDMTEGSVYSTNIAIGDNENRFKLLVKQNVGLAEVEELDVRITNSNRHIAVQTAENNLTIEVYNTLGQKVYETKEHNFILNEASAGVYMIKAYNNKASKTTKIVIQ